MTDTGWTRYPTGTHRRTFPGLLAPNNPRAPRRLRRKGPAALSRTKARSTGSSGKYHIHRARGEGMHRGLGTERDGDIPREIPCEQLPLGTSHHSQLRVQRHQGQACWIEPFSRSSQDGTPAPVSSKAFELGMPVLVLVIPASIGCRKVFFPLFVMHSGPH